jgi:pimeloyl-ACP methyl ester carboxylesterase
MRQTVNSDPVERLKKITAPTLLLWGERDRMIPSSNSLDYERALPNSKTVILPKASHLLQEENPEVGLKSVLDFINMELR